MPRACDETSLHEFLTLATTTNNDQQGYDQFMLNYEIQLTKLKEVLDAPCNRGHKHNLVYCLTNFGYYDDTKAVVHNLLQRIQSTSRSKEDNPDFAITPLIRILFAPEPQHFEILPPASTDSTRYTLSLLKSLLFQALGHYPFWPEDGGRNKELDQITFWSENHLLMTLSGGYLFQRYLQANLISNPQVCQEWIEGLNRLKIRELLCVYLQAHSHDQFQGFYEVNSIVYAQFTIAALLNLIDFADKEIAQLAEVLLDIIVKQLMCCTDPLYGVVNLAGNMAP
jgi:hypothetical protein